jgi:hypothetical protein
MFENSLLKRIFGSKIEKEDGNNEEFYRIYSSSNDDYI